MSKEQLVKCYICRTQDSKDNLIREELGFNKILNANTHRYYHELCFKLKENKGKLNCNVKYDNESDEHRKGKRLLTEYFFKNKVKLLDQFENEVKLNYDFISTECPITYNHGEIIPYLDTDDCSGCFNTCSMSKYDKSELISKIRVDKLYKSIKGKVCLKQHPCIDCIFNTVNYRHIFDVGLGKNGKYIGAIEVYKTHGVSKEKLIYCIKNNIELFEVDAKLISKLNYKVKTVEVNKLWWIEDGKVQIHSKYHKYLSVND